MAVAVKTPKGYKLSKDARTKRANMAKLARQIYQKSVTETRDMSAEEAEKFDKLVKEVDELDTRIEKLEKVDEDDEDDEDDNDASDLEDRDDDSDDDDKDSKKERSQHDDKDGERRDTRDRDGDGRTRNKDGRRSGSRADAKNNPSRRAAPQSGLRQNAWESEQHFRDRQRRSTQQYFDAVSDYLRFGDAALMTHTRGNKRALQADVDIMGGYLILPEQISNRILKKVDNILQLQQLATVVKVENAQSLGIPTLDNDPEDGDWTTEIAAIDPDTAMTFGKRALTPSPIRKRLLVSERWLRMAFSAAFQSADDANGAGGSPENIVINRLAYKIAATKESAFFLGNGVGKPLGMFTASSRGISTGRDVVTGSATTFTYQGLLNIKFTLKTQYQQNSAWMLSRTAMPKLMGLVDTAGRPLLNFMTLPNQPTTLMERPLYMSEYTPSTFTTGLYVGMLADFSYYQIVDSQDITVKRADELYAETGQVGFFISAESDGMPVLEEAFVRIKTN